MPQKRSPSLWDEVDQAIAPTPSPSASSSSVWDEVDRAVSEPPPTIGQRPMPKGASASGTTTSARVDETTILTPAEEQAFQHWARTSGITDVDHPDSHYDYRGFFKATNGQPVMPSPNRHFPDTFKQHGHPTFSVESQYSRGPEDGGRWNGEQFVAPPQINVGPQSVLDKLGYKPQPIAPTPPEAPLVRSRTGQMYRPTPMGTMPILDAPHVGVQQIAKGAGELYDAATDTAPVPVSTEPLRRSRTGALYQPPPPIDARTKAGVADIVEGGMTASEPLVAGMGLAAPLPVASTLVKAAVASKATETVLNKLGVDPGNTRLAADVVGAAAAGIPLEGMARDAIRAGGEWGRARQSENIPWAPGQGPRAAERALTPEVPGLPAAGEPGASPPSAPIPVTPRTPESVPPAGQVPPLVVPPVAARPGGTAAGPVAPSPEPPPVAPSADVSPVWQAVDQAITPVEAPQAPPARYAPIPVEKQPDGSYRRADASPVWQAVDDAIAPVDTGGRELGGYAGPERRTAERVSTPAEDERYARMREKIATGEPTGTEESRQDFAERQSVEEARRQGAVDEVRAMEPEHKEVSPEQKEPSAQPDVWHGVEQAIAEEKKPDREFSSTQIELPGEHAEALRALAAKIPDEHLAEDGREGHPHVTVKFGLHTNDPEEVRRLLADEPPITVRLGKTSLFPAKEGANYDVVKADVDSPDLHRLNAKIAGALEHTDTHPEYKPHATLAYVKPGLGKQYEGDASLEGREATIGAITFSGKDRNETVIPLGGVHAVEKPGTAPVDVGQPSGDGEALGGGDTGRPVAGTRGKAKKEVPNTGHTTPAAKPVGKFADLSPHERREVRRIQQELASYQYEGRTRTVLDSVAKGKDEIWAAGHGGAPVFSDIMEGRGGSRGNVERAIASYINGRRPSGIAQRVVDVARRRLVGDVHLSTPILPPDAGDEPGGVYVTRRTDLPEDESRVQRAAAERLERNPSAAIKAYRKRFGNVVSADLAKEIVSREYAASNDNRAKYARAVQGPSSALARAVYRQMLEETRNQPGLVVFTAGGTGSGKTSSLDLFPSLKADAEIVYDSTLALKQGAGEDIQAALGAGKEVGVLFTYRDAEAAFRGVLKRAGTEGRTVTVGAHARTHARAIDVVRSLMNQYRDDDRVMFTFVDNSGETLRDRSVTDASILDRRAYNVEHVQAQLRTILEHEHAAGHVSDAIYQGTLGTESQQGAGEAVQGKVRAGSDAGRKSVQREASSKPVTPKKTVLDTLSTGEKQSRLPGAESARQAGKADTTFKAPQQASGDDFMLGPIETPEATARRNAAENPELFGESLDSDTSTEKPKPYSKAAMRDAFNLTDEQAEATDALVKAMKIDTDKIVIAKGGTSSSDALRQDAAPIFFSALTRAAEKLPQAKGSPDQMLAMLTKAKGVKQEELAWSGVRDWLSSQSGTVTKDAIVDYLRANELHVSEVMLGAEDPALSKKRGEQLALSDEIDKARAKAFGPGTQGTEPGLIHPHVVEKIARWATRGVIFARAEVNGLGLKPEIRDAVLRYVELAHRSHILNEEVLALRKPTKFDNWQVPGSRNYRELLITLPNPPTHWVDGSPITAEDLSTEHGRAAAERVGSTERPDFRGGHFDEPNIIAHVRFNDRVGHDGAKVLFVEEVQSDWHQKGRKHGYRGSDRLIDGHDYQWWSDEASRLFGERSSGKAKVFRVGGDAVSWDDMRNKIADRAMALGGTHSSAYSWAGSLAHNLTRLDKSLDESLKAFDPDTAEYFRSLDEEDPQRGALARRNATAFVSAAKEMNVKSRHQEIDEEWRKAVQNRDKLAGKPDEVPDAPFKTTWPELALKRIVRYAAEHGYDRVAWTPGDVQADRYDLSKQIDSIRYQKQQDGTYDLIVMKDGHGVDLPRSTERLTLSQVADLVGKEIAHKIELGDGEASKSTATQAMMKRGRAAIDKIFEKKPGQWFIPHADGTDYGVWPSKESAVRAAQDFNYQIELAEESPERELSGVDLRVGGTGMRGFYDKMLPSALNKLAKPFGGKVGETYLEGQKGLANDSPAHAVAIGAAPAPSLDITPDMRSAALEGQPLFQPAYHGSPHRFEQFSLHHIGKGEGAQAYGWGLYFASKREVADEYRKRLAGQPQPAALAIDGVRIYERAKGAMMEQDDEGNDKLSKDLRLGLLELHSRSHWLKPGQEWIPRLRKDLTQTIKNYEEALAKGEPLMMETGDSRDNPTDVANTLSRERFRLADAKAALHALDVYGERMSILPAETPGRTYKVEIPENEDYLDWDKRLDQQPPKIRKALETLELAYSDEDVEAANKEYRDAYAAYESDKGVNGGEGKGNRATPAVFKRLEDAHGRFAAVRESNAIRGHDLYENLTRAHNPRYASEKLAALGISGIKYLDGGSRANGEGTHNYVIFDDKLVQVMEYDQGAKGSAEFAADGKAIIRGFAAADVSTGIHEIVHVARRQLLNRSVPAEQRHGISDDDIAIAEQWAGATGGTWSVAAEEKLARGFERYLIEGKAPTDLMTGADAARLKGLFDKFAAWMRGIYQTVEGSPIDVHVSEPMRKVFDRMVTRGTTPVIARKIAQSSTAAPRRSTVTAQSAVVPGLKEFVEQDVAPGLKAAAEEVDAARKDIRILFAPDTVSDASRLFAGVMRANLAAHAQRVQRAQKVLGKLERAFDKRSNEDNLRFMDAIEGGDIDALPKDLRAAAQQLRGLLDKKRGDVQRRGRLQQYIDNYFPHEWKQPGKAKQIISQIFGRRPLQGPKSFLKKRKIPTVAEGIKLGLEPTSYNPVTLVLHKLAEMDKWMMAHDILKDAKSVAVAKFVAVGTKAPEGWQRYHESFGTVYAPPFVKVEEAFDERLMEKLHEFATSLGITTVRKVKIAQKGSGVGGKAWGYAVAPSGPIATKFAGPETVLEHEIGHVLDWKYGLWEKIKQELEEERFDSNEPNPANELRELADKRFEGKKDPGSSFKRYVRKKEEKMANLVHAFIYNPEMTKSVAPNAYWALYNLAKDNPELTPLIELQKTKSLVLGTATAEQRVPGMVIGGHYYGPPEAVRLLNNYLSPGLRGNVAFDLYRRAGNFLNQVQLGLSAFHLTMTGLEAIVSKAAQAAMETSRGVTAVTKGQLPIAMREFGHAAKSTAQVPFATFIDLFRGHQALKDFYAQDANARTLAGVTDLIIHGGGGIGWDVLHHDEMPQKFMRALRQGNYLGAAWRSVPAFFEMVSKPIMEQWVPRLKLGAYLDLARMELRTLGPEPDLTEVQRVLGDVWDSIDNRFGEMRYDNLFWHNVQKDLGMASVRALGWNVGTVREVFGAPSRQFKHLRDRPRRKVNTGRDKDGNRTFDEQADPWMTHKFAYAIIALPIVYGLLGATYNYLHTGERPKELRDYFFPRTGHTKPDGTAERVSIPGYFKDAYAVLHDFPQSALTTMGHKLQPLLDMLYEMLQNEDFYGTEIRNPDDPRVEQLKQIVGFVADDTRPISIRNYERRRESFSGTGISGVESFFGISEAPASVTQTAAEKLLRRYLPPSTHTKHQFELMQERRQLRDALRTGNRAAASEIAGRGNLSERQLETAARTSRLSALQRGYQSLTLEQALNIYEIANPDERAELRTMLERKGANVEQAAPADREKLMRRLRAAGALPYTGKKSAVPVTAR